MSVRSLSVGEVAYLQNLIMVGYGIVTPQNVAKTNEMKGLNNTAVWMLGEMAAMNCPIDTP